MIVHDRQTQSGCVQKEMSKTDFLLHLYRIRLISLASQKFISDIANDALQYCKMKGTASGSSRSKTKVSVSHFNLHIKYNIWQCCVLGRGSVWSLMLMLTAFKYSDHNICLTIVFLFFVFVCRTRSTLWLWKIWLPPSQSMASMSRNHITSHRTVFKAFCFC